MFFLEKQEHVDFNLSSNPCCKPFGRGGICWKKTMGAKPQPPDMNEQRNVRKCPKSQTENTHLQLEKMSFLVTLDFWEVVNHLFNPCNIQTLTFHEILIGSWGSLQ